MSVRITFTKDRNKIVSPLKITKLEGNFKGEHKYGNSKYNEFHFNKDKYGNSEELYKLVDKHVKKGRLKNAKFCVITLCKIKNKDSNKFLSQFFSILPHMKESPGFVDFRLYKSRNKKSNFNYINIATWSCIKELENTFSKIQKIGLVKGGFDSTSEVAICNLPEIKKGFIS
ncbi:hypothetical protein [Pseudoalteromonas luteoviolacea]|uniref:ABM domain-containing protein n=1 Tax=Pseudoalteromonas luteoviolacea NCIMB 1942 TaxID=1365253 RepID=A0A166Y915_9GAMM|nr:hypothetical protein [Pseudoalteromonas luteoviolacea]KZN41573.1 hypothetical protein N482_20055 [Pseudoalteromonas luteoviolacea NCIMB 1942]KZW98462.1 hypothetical protein JL49_23325 [Pseudoalteromonas luteoviolacea]